MHGISLALIVFTPVFNASVACDEPVTKSIVTNNSCKEPMQMEISPFGRLSPRARAMLQSKMERKATKTKRRDRSTRSPAPTPASKVSSGASNGAANQPSQRTANPALQIKVKEPLKMRPLAEVHSTSEEPSTTEATEILDILYDEDERPGPPVYFLALLVVFVLGICWKMDFFFGYENAPPEETTPRSRQETFERTEQGLPEDMYGVIIGCILWDAYCLEESSAHTSIRRARTFFVAFLHYLGLFLQCALLFVITYYSAAQAVQDIRVSYSKYEKLMYGEDVYLDESGFFRGKSVHYLKTDNFAHLDEKLKSKICRIPFSQPFILMLLLYMWSLCVLGDVKHCYELADRLVWNVRPCNKLMENENGESLQHSLAILKIPRYLRLLIGFGVILPRVIVDGILLWLGCRWLAATPDFGNLVLNSVGLEFVLNLPQISYRTVVSEVNKRDAKRVTLDISEDSVIPTPHSFFVTTIWGIAASIWTIAYIFHIQQVLPAYKWDVRAICTNWMLEHVGSLRKLPVIK